MILIILATNDGMGWLIPLILILIAAFLYFVFWGLYKLVEVIAIKAFDFPSNKSAKKYKINSEERENIRNSLSDFLYFQKLSFAGKEKFLDRTVSFLLDLEIY